MNLTSKVEKRVMSLTLKVEKRVMSLILKAGKKKKNKENHMETPRSGEKEEDPNSP